MSNTAIAILGISFIFLMTTLGSAVVFFFRKSVNEKFATLFLGFASGIMIAASIWSLLLPAIEGAANYGKLNFLPAAIGFLLGGGFLVLLDKIVPHTHNGAEGDEGPKAPLKRSTKLFLAVTMHNIPEGLSVGLAFGSAIVLGETSAYLAALGLAIGIGIQNFPEGAAISLPMKRETGSNFKAFLYGMGSGAVEPIAAVVGLLLATFLQSAMPWMLAFAAGAMIFVVAEELIPEAAIMGKSHLGTWGVMAGFVLMMILDVALG